MDQQLNSIMTLNCWIIVTKLLTWSTQLQSRYSKEGAVFELPCTFCSSHCDLSCPWLKGNHLWQHWSQPVVCVGHPCKSTQKKEHSCRVVLYAPSTFCRFLQVQANASLSRKLARNECRILDPMHCTWEDPNSFLGLHPWLSGLGPIPEAKGEVPRTNLGKNSLSY